MLTTLRRGLVAILLLLCLAALFVGGWLGWSFLASKPLEQGTLIVESAPGTARVVRDEWGVAHVFGEGDAEVFFALGFTHASERFFQMDLIRRYVRGELADMFGEEYLRVDARTRTLGYARVTKDLVVEMGSDARRAVEAYVAGVNARLARGRVAPEYAILRQQPRPWEVADTAAVLVSFADDLAAGGEADADRVRLRSILTPRQLDQFFAPFPGWAPTSLKDEDLDATGFESEEIAPPVAFAQDDVRAGSNAWVVSGWRSETGMPLLANDPHLGLATPSIWYYARLNLSFGPVIGVTAPGAPFVILGRNTRGAWGFTNTGFDVIDLVERDPAAVEVEERTESISISGGSRTVEITVRETPEGPVMDPEWFDLDGYDKERIVVRRSTINSPGNRGADAALAVMRSTDWSSFVDAGRVYTVPMQNQHYASVDGTIGYTTAGLLPIRDPDSGDWRGFVEFEDLPRVVNPQGGFIASGNNLVASQAYPYPLQGKYSIYRAPRIETLLTARDRHSVASFAKMQLDVQSELLVRIMPTLLAAESKSELGQAALARLASWDSSLQAEGPEGLIVSAWLRELASAIWADELGPAAGVFLTARRAFLERVLRSDASSWCDDTRTETVESCATVAGKALDKAMARTAEDHGSDIDAWRWGAVHEADFDHPLGGLPFLGSLFENRVGVPGDGSTVNVTHFRYSSGNYDVYHAASMRAIYDLSDLNNSLFMHAPGQSGHPLSPHHGDLAEPWARGEYFQIRDDWSWEEAPPGSRVLSIAPRVEE